jgi:hypothetical protein
VRIWMISMKNFASLHALSLTLALLRAFCPESPLPFALTQSRSGCTVVIWPIREATRSSRQGSPRTSTGRLLTWWSHQWMLSKMLAIHGRPGEADGILLTPYTSNSPEPPNARNKEANP